MKQNPLRPGVYVTPEGRVFVESTVGHPGFGGYLSVRVRGKLVRHHTLVAETFCGTPEPGQSVRHLDGNPANNAPSNLRWGTQRENVADTIRHERDPRGERGGQAKLTNAQAAEIKARRAAGEKGSALAVEFGVSPQTICGIHKGRYWPSVQGEDK